MERRNFLKSSISAAVGGVGVSPIGLSRETSKVVLITGCSSGFGYEMALVFARAGYITYASMRDRNGSNKGVADELEQIGLQEEISLYAVSLDITRSEQILSAVEHIVETEGRLDVVVNNAGIFMYTPVELVTEGMWNYQMRTNVFGPMELVSTVMPQMRKQGSGLIVQVSSRVGQVVIPGISLYCSSKAALECATEAAHYEATRQGIDFAIIQPTAYGTSINPNARKIFRDFTLPELEKHRPQGTAYFSEFLQQLDRDFEGIPVRDPREVAELSLQIAETPRENRVLRYPIGDQWEADPLREINAFRSRQQRQALSGRYESWFRN